MPQPTSGKTATGSRARHRPDDPQRGVDEHEDGKVVAEVPLALEAVKRLGAKLVLGRGDDGLLGGHVGRRHATEARRGVHGRRTADGSGADRCPFRSPASRCASASVAIGPAAGRRPALSLWSRAIPTAAWAPPAARCERAARSRSSGDTAPGTGRGTRPTPPRPAPCGPQAVASARPRSSFRFRQRPPHGAAD